MTVQGVVAGRGTRGLAVTVFAEPMVWILGATQFWAPATQLNRNTRTAQTAIPHRRKQEIRLMKATSLMLRRTGARGRECEQDSSSCGFITSAPANKFRRTARLGKFIRVPRPAVLPFHTHMILQTEVFQFEPDITGISCSGRFTMGTRLSETEALIHSLIEKGLRKLVLDLTHVDVVDSAGLGVLMRAFGELHERGGQLRIAGPSEQVRRLLQITHTASILPIDAELVTSVQKLQQPHETTGVHA